LVYMTTNRKGLKELRSEALVRIAENAQRDVSIVKKCYDIANMVINHVEYDIGTIEESEYEVYFSHWGKEVDFSEIKRKDIYDSFLMALTDLFGEGKRDKSYDDKVRYTFDDKNGCTIELKVSTELTGCRLVTEEVVVPESIVPQHIESKTVIKCDS
jgi:hypothetical protein